MVVVVVSAAMVVSGKQKNERIDTINDVYMATIKAKICKNLLSDCVLLCVCLCVLNNWNMNCIPMEEVDLVFSSSSSFSIWIE